MSSLVASVCDGTVEVRNYADLPELFSDKLVVYGWRFSLALDALGNLEVLRWVVFSHFSWPKVRCNSLFATIALIRPKQPETSKKLKRGLKRAYGTSRPKEDSLPVSIQSLSLTTNTHLDLDYTPFSSLESSLLRLRSTLAPGALASLEFTTPTPSVTFLSTQFTICAVPFMTRKYPGGSGAPNRNRTATPLLASLHRVLELLTAGPAALALESVSNVSQQYADGLTAAAEHLEDDRATRTTLIQQCGMAAWREQRLMMAWEAALFSAGHLSRWVVVVRK
ncbi:hypothetical protein C8R43DRAFT_153168 [Mycena crocata]|nr:hypothetical protein C8R43DRAFT_153168 [Mycena crocata]